MLRGVLLGIGHIQIPVDVLHVEGSKAFGDCAIQKRGATIVVATEIHGLEVCVVNFDAPRTNIRDIEEKRSTCRHLCKLCRTAFKLGWDAIAPDTSSKVRYLPSAPLLDTISSTGIYPPQRFGAGHCAIAISVYALSDVRRRHKDYKNVVMFVTWRILWLRGMKRTLAAATVEGLQRNLKRVDCSSESETKPDAPSRYWLLPNPKAASVTRNDERKRIGRSILGLPSAVKRVCSESTKFVCRANRFIHVCQYRGLKH